MFTILFTGNTFSSDEQKILLSEGYEIVPGSMDMNKNELIAKLKTVDAYIVGGKEIVSEDIIEAASKNLKLIVFPGIKTGTIDVKAAKKFRIPVANTPKVSTYSVAELTVSLLLTLNKHILNFSHATRNGIWQSSAVYDLKDKTVGIIGMGVIGTYTARILKHGFNMKILYSDICHKFAVEEELSAEKTTLENICKLSDFISIHATLDDSNRSMIGKKELQLMKKTAVLINTARAWLVNPDDLYIALKENWIAGAAFDGFYSEPIDKNQPGGCLLDLPESKFIVTPHTGFNVYENEAKIHKVVIENIKSVLTNKYCPNIVE